MCVFFKVHFSIMTFSQPIKWTVHFKCIWSVSKYVKDSLSLFIIMLMNIINKAYWCQSVSFWSMSWTWLISHMNKESFHNIIILQWNNILLYHWITIQVYPSFSHSLFMKSTSRDSSGKQPLVMSQRAFAPQQCLSDFLVQQRLLSDNPARRTKREETHKSR